MGAPAAAPSPVFNLSECDLAPGDLVEARQLMGLSQGELATWLGVSRSTVNAWENGRRTITGPVGLAVAFLEHWTAKGVELTRVA